MVAYCRVQQCCCGCTLQSGVKILAIIGLISAFIWLILSSIAIHKVLHSDPVMIKQNSPELYNAFIHLSENMGLLVGLLVLMILTILSDGLSLYPACTKKKPNLLIVVLVFSAIVTVGWLYVGIGALIGRDYFGGVFLLVLIAVRIYFWIVVFSFRSELMENQNKVANHSLKAVS